MMTKLELKMNLVFLKSKKNQSDYISVNFNAKKYVMDKIYHRNVLMKVEL